MVEVVQRHDQPDVVLSHELGERVDVSGVGDAWDDRLQVSVVERGRERVGVRCERHGPGGTESTDDVHPLTRAGEEDDRHGRRAYSESGRRSGSDFSLTSTPFPLA